MAVVRSTLLICLTVILSLFIWIFNDYMMAKPVVVTSGDKVFIVDMHHKKVEICTDAQCKQVEMEQNVPKLDPAIVTPAPNAACISPNIQSPVPAQNVPVASVTPAPIPQQTPQPQNNTLKQATAPQNNNTVSMNTQSYAPQANQGDSGYNGDNYYDETYAQQAGDDQSYDDGNYQESSAPPAGFN